MSSPAFSCIPVTKATWQKLGGYSFRHVNQVFEPKTIHNILNGGPTADLAEAKVADLDQITVTLPDNSKPTVRHIIDATDTDGWMVLHHGRVVIEEYPGDNPYDDEYPGKMPEDTEHLLMSVTKSLTGTLAGILQHMPSEVEGRDFVLQPGDLVTDYVDPQELGTSAYLGATVREVLDMRSAIKFSEAYSDPDSEVREMEAAAGWGPSHPSYPNDTLKAFLGRLTKIPGRQHGDNGPFEYRSCEAAMVGWICEEAHNKYGRAGKGDTKTFAELVSDLLWKKIGAEKAAYITVDQEGTGAFDGGICATLRDLARFGAMICRNGVSLPTSSAPDGQQVVSEKWVEDIFTARDTEDAFRESPKYDEMRMPDGKYRSMFWAPTINRDVVLCIGVYGQMVYINRATQTVGVKLSSANQAVALDDLGGTWGNGYPAFLMFDKISARLGRNPLPPAGITI